jgi:hypothetical protein
MTGSGGSFPGFWRARVTMTRAPAGSALPKQRREHRVSLIGQHIAARDPFALDQPTHHHLLRRGVRDAGALPVGLGRETEQQDALRHEEAGCDRGSALPARHA